MKIPSLLHRLALPSLAALFIQTAAGVTVNIGPVAGPGTASSYEYRDDYGLFYIAELAPDPTPPAPILISTDAGTAGWTQTLTFAPGAANLTTGDVFIVQQLLEVAGGGFALNNWRQEILTPGWQWSDSTIYNNDTSFELAGLNVIAGAQDVGFSFSNLADGQEFLIVQVLEYTGPDGAAPAPITLRASVVPEPGAASLLALGSAAFLFRSRRRHP